MNGDDGKSTARDRGQSRTPPLPQEFTTPGWAPGQTLLQAIRRLVRCPDKDLEALSESLASGMDCHPASQVLALQAMVGEELRARAAANGG